MTNNDIVAFNVSSVSFSCFIAQLTLSDLVGFFYRGWLAPQRRPCPHIGCRADVTRSTSRCMCQNTNSRLSPPLSISVCFSVAIDYRNEPSLNRIRGSAINLTVYGS